LCRAAELAQAHLDGLDARPAGGTAGYDDVVAALDGPLPAGGEDATAVVERLASVVGPATVASPGPRYFGFVTGGALPAALAADWLVSTWDQNAFSRMGSPAGAAVEAVTARWVLEALGLPPTAAVGFSTGATSGNMAGLAAARHAVLARQGWDVEADGLIGAPPVPVYVGGGVHASLLKALRVVGFGSERAIRVETDDMGAMRADALERALADGPAIVCAQAGEVNSGACDPLEAIVATAHERGAWVHVDGAFGLWAAASPRYRHLVAGLEGADSWSVDAHKWLNVPYDSGLAIVADAAAMRAALGSRASYLPDTAGGEPFEHVLEMSRRARAVPVYAALASLGRDGLADLVERPCALARRVAAAVDELDGAEVLNDVVLNQVLVRFGDDDATTPEVVAAVQRGGEAWLGQTVWRGRAAARVSISNWSTTEADVDRLVAAFADALSSPSRARQL
jgi:glutamate/tyrosine decarboxylase-like PLP-dependent enzyme